ncbi:hypothetical protein MSAN_00243700 [Mycena sanguinolenta]|uniref:Mitochondrial carrier n=1 Tax=Mycena sanguinolenta TaxID=230812 RepID=A0A8H7DP16_9AGAR|nr:hypothetical protein MSAN_00243700 [Mycena sanguinolenta]
MQDPIPVLIPGVVDFAVWIATTGIMLAIAIPFTGILVRYRANYTPKTGAVHLDDEAALDTAAAPRVDASIGYFGMLKRVYRLEGWAGLYKGTMPTIVAAIIALGVRALVRVLQFTGPTVPPLIPLLQWTIQLGRSTIPALLIFPMQIIINRAITTPYKLAAFPPRIALRTLLSPAERAQPLRLYLAPGVALSIFLEACVVFALQLSTNFLFGLPSPSWKSAAVLGTLVPALVLGTLFITPLEVLTARLTLQRRRGPGPGASSGVEATAAADPVPLYSAEPVMDFRPVLDIGTDAVAEEGGEEPYTGLLDCARKIVAEEGWGVLARAWWLNAALMALAGTSLIIRAGGN